MADIEKVMGTKVTTKTVEVTEEVLEEVVLRLKPHEMDVLAYIIGQMDVYTAGGLNLWELKDTVTEAFGKQRQKFTWQQNTLGFLRIEKTT